MSGFGLSTLAFDAASSSAKPAASSPRAKSTAAPCVRTFASAGLIFVARSKYFGGAVEVALQQRDLAGERDDRAVVRRARQRRRQHFLGFLRLALLQVDARQQLPRVEALRIEPDRLGQVRLGLRGLVHRGRDRAREQLREPALRRRSQRERDRVVRTREVLPVERDQRVHVGHARMARRLLLQRVDLFLREVELMVGDVRAREVDAGREVARILLQRGPVRLDGRRRRRPRTVEVAAQHERLDHLRIDGEQRVDVVLRADEVAGRGLHPRLRELRVGVVRHELLGRGERRHRLVLAAFAEQRVAEQRLHRGVRFGRLEVGAADLLRDLLGLPFEQLRLDQQRQHLLRVVLDVVRLLQLDLGALRVALQQQLATEQEAGLAGVRIGLQHVLEFDDGGRVALLGRERLAAREVFLRLVAMAGGEQHRRRGERCDGEAGFEDGASPGHGVLLPVVVCGGIVACGGIVDVVASIDRLSADAEAPHEVVQRRPADAEHLGSPCDVAVDLAEHLQDGAPFGVVADLAQVEDPRLGVLDVEREVLGADELIRRP